MEQSYAIKPFEAYRATFAPVLRAQQEGLQALSRFVRLQYTIAGDVMEHNLAALQAMASATSPMEYFAKQGQLNVRFVDKLATHAREFLSESADRLAPESAAAIDVVLPTEEEIVDVDDEEERAAQLLEEGEVSEDEPSGESIEARPAESSRKSTTTKHGGKRSDKSRRGQAHH